MNHSSNKSSLLDVATLAGVSAGTVSRVLNKHPDVGKDYVRRVQEAIEELGYEPDPIASSLRQRRIQKSESSRTQTFGFLIDGATPESFLGNEYQQQFFFGIEKAASENGRHLLCAGCAEDMDAGRLPAMVRDLKVDGVIVRTFRETNTTWLQALAKIVPVVLLMTKSADLDLPSVLCDNQSGIRLVFQKLKELGHERIGFLAVKDTHIPRSLHNEERLAAFRQLTNLPENDPFIQIPRRDWDKEPLDDVVARALSNWLALGTKRPTAIIASADVYAVSLLRVAQKKGLRLPEDLSVTGFMNTREAETSEPPLSSVSIAGEEIGRATLLLLKERVEHPEQSIQHLTIAGKWIPRLSCSALS